MPTPFHLCGGGEGEFFRYSGDEFICLSRERMEEHLEKLQVPSVDGIEFIGFSYGTSQFPENGMTAADLFRYADNKMYLNKNNKYVK